MNGRYAAKQGYYKSGSMIYLSDLQVGTALCITAVKILYIVKNVVLHAVVSVEMPEKLFAIYACFLDCLLQTVCSHCLAQVRSVDKLQYLWQLTQLSRPVPSKQLPALTDLLHQPFFAFESNARTIIIAFLCHKEQAGACFNRPAAPFFAFVSNAGFNHVKAFLQFQPILPVYG